MLTAKVGPCGVESSLQVISSFMIWKPRDNAGNRTYQPCTQPPYRTVLIRNWHGVTYSNSTEIFTFELEAEYSGYASACRGQRSGDTSSGWMYCDVRDDDAFLSARFDFSKNDYLTVYHTYMCDRGEAETDPRNRLANVIATGNRRLLLSLVDTPEGPYTGTEGDNCTIPAYPQIAHRLPKADCGAASTSAEWELRDFAYNAAVIRNPEGLGTTSAFIFSDLYNTANEYLISCQASNSSTFGLANDPTLLDPAARWPCPGSTRNDLFPPEAYPTTGIRFNRSSNEITIEQDWVCEDENGNE
ncbi:hypothetical protein GGR54DRAFT_633453 [Hypoxylon sp. NC1633]|nr:hypothetical protein GGR54DRAFT_633453 [Hypoxylon sp. NC1633]